MEQRNTEARRPNPQGKANTETEWPKPIGDLLEDLQVPEKMIRGESFLAKQHQDRKEAAQQKRDDVVQLADDALKQLDAELQKGKSDTLIRFLSTISAFHSYSFNNQLLIMIQRPDASQVAGFNAWKKLGRFVMKGEKGIRILAPMVGNAKDDEVTIELAADGEPKKRIYGFRVVSVFDVSQTDGDPLPDIGKIKGEPGDNLQKLRDLITAKGITLEYEKLNGPEGVSRGGTIVIDTELDAANEFSVLAHELAHEMLHRGDRRKDTTKTQRETEAEAVAFVVCQAFGIDTSARANDYIQLYRGDSETLAESLDYIRTMAAETINSLSK